MASTTDMNIVLGQGSVIKEVHNVRKQNLEVNQQFVAQKTEDEKKKDKSKVQEFDTENRVEIRGDDEKENRENPEDNQKGSKKKKKPKEELKFSNGNHLIDIKV